MSSVRRLSADGCTSTYARRRTELPFVRARQSAISSSPSSSVPSGVRSRGSRPAELSHTRVSWRTNGWSGAQRKNSREIRLCVMFCPGNV